MRPGVELLGREFCLWQEAQWKLWGDMERRPSSLTCREGILRKKGQGRRQARNSIDNNCR